MERRSHPHLPPPAQQWRPTAGQATGMTLPPCSPSHVPPGKPLQGSAGHRKLTTSSDVRFEFVHQYVKLKRKGFGSGDFIPAFVALLNDSGAFECLVELVRAFGSACPSLLRGEPMSPKELFQATELAFHSLRRLASAKKASRDNCPAGHLCPLRFFRVGLAAKQTRQRKLQAPRRCYAGVRLAVGALRGRSVVRAADSGVS